MNGKVDQTGIRHSVAERLRFIDTHLFWHGRINRADVIGSFGVSPAQAAADLKEYLAQSGRGVQYDTRAKAYIANGGFRPVFGLPNAVKGLEELGTSGDPLIEKLLPLERPVDPALAARLRRAARDGEKVRIHYQSFTKPQPSWRWVAPSRLVSDGQRWHMRAWCFRESSWKDFVLARVIELGEAADAGELPEDSEWIERVELVLAPSDQLSKGQRASVVREFGMQGGALRVTLPRAMRLYALRRWGLDRPDSRLVVAEERTVD